MIVPIINKERDKDKLLELINNCGLTKTEISKRTASPPQGNGKISIQTMYDLESKKPDGKPDQLKVFQLKEILRVIGEHQNKEISIGQFLSPKIEKMSVVLEWNFKKGRYESPNLFKSKAKAIYFPNLIHTDPNTKAIITYPKTIEDVNFAQDEYYKDHKDEAMTFRKDARASLFNISYNDWHITQPDKLLWRTCLAKVKDKNYYFNFLPHKFTSENTAIGQRYLGYVYRQGLYTGGDKQMFWVPAHEYMELEFSEIYPIFVVDMAIDGENNILDLE